MLDPSSGSTRLNLEFLKIQDGGGRHPEKNHKNRDISATV